MIPAAAVVVPAVSGVLGWQIAGLAVGRGRRDVLLRLVLAPGIGLGASSLALFATLLLAGPQPVVFIAVELAMVAALAVLLRRRRSRALDESNCAEAPGATGSRWIAAALAAAFAAGAGISAIGFSARVAGAPHGSWDAWAIWNLKARFLATAGDDWTRMFSNMIEWSHPDYPLLLPGSVAQVWIATGATSTAVPAAIAAVFTFSAVLLLVVALTLSRGMTQGLLAGLVLLAARGFTEYGSSMCADVPLSFFMLAAMVALALHEDRRDGCWPMLAGIAASMAAWTKNEGVPFLLLTACAMVFSSMRRERRRTAWRDLGAFAAGAVPALVCLVALKMRFAPTNDLVQAASEGDAGSTLWDLARHREVAAGFLHEAGTCFGIRGSWVVWLVLAAHAAATGIGMRSFRGAPIACVAVVLGTFASYYIVFLVSSDDPGALVRGSLHRISFQLAPCVILLLFLIGRPPEPAAASDSEGPGT